MSAERPVLVELYTSTRGPERVEQDNWRFWNDEPDAEPDAAS